MALRIKVPFRSTSILPTLYKGKKSFRLKTKQRRLLQTRFGQITRDTPFKYLVDKSPVSIIIINENKNIVYVNEAWEKLTGYSLRYTVSKKLEMFESGDITANDVVDKLLDGKILKPISVDIFCKYKDGKKHITHSEIHRIPGKTRHPVYVQYLHPISSSEVVNEAANVLNRRISHILNSISDGFISLDNDWKFTYINTLAEKVLGVNKDELYGRNIWEALPQLKEINLYEKFQEAMKSQEVMRITAKLFSKGWYRIRLYPAEDGLSVYLYNITEQVEKEQEKDNFISTASHEIKTPVTSIKAYAYILRKKLIIQNNSEVLHLFHKMEVQINRLQGLVDDLLDVHRIQNGKLVITPDYFSLHHLLKEVIENCSHLSNIHKIVLQKTLRSQVCADKEMIREVLTNLISNAIKYSPNGGDIIIKAGKKIDNIIVSIQDSGIGIPSHMTEKIFNRFTRIENTEYHISGLGLGLYISAEIIKQHGGRIWVESTEKKGSTFFFTLPIRKGQ